MPLCNCCRVYFASPGHELCVRCLDAPRVPCERDRAEDCDRLGFVPAVCVDGEWSREDDGDLCYYCENYPRHRSQSHAVWRTA